MWETTKYVVKVRRSIFSLGAPCYSCFDTGTLCETQGTLIHILIWGD